MRVMIAPMAAMAETSGPFSRAAALCGKLIEKGHEVALCAAKDINYRKIPKVKNYEAPIPSPFGTPRAVGGGLLKIAQSLGLQQKKEVKSFEQVLHFVGATSGRFFGEDVDCIRNAIRDFKPDVVYAEFRVAAIVAAKLEKIPAATGYSFPVQKSYAKSPEYSKGVKKFLRENDLPPIESVLDVFDWADLKIVPSSYELEPIDDEKAVFTGPFFLPYIESPKEEKKNILAYVGVGTLSPKTVVNSLKEAFNDTDYQVYIASEQIEPFQERNIHVDKRFDFNKLMPEAAAYINHGGQNSVMTGLIYGVPQILCPGNVFERRYNAASVVHLKAGAYLEASKFNAENIKSMINRFEQNLYYSNNAKKAGEQLLSLGGTEKAVKALEKLVSEKQPQPEK